MRQGVASRFYCLQDASVGRSGGVEIHERSYLSLLIPSDIGIFSQITLPVPRLTTMTLSLPDGCHILLTLKLVINLTNNHLQWRCKEAAAPR
jgi:hypothetical protein